MTTPLSYEKDMKEMDEQENGRVSDTLNSLVRYDLVGDYDDYIDEISDGDYVKFEDVKQMLSND